MKKLLGIILLLITYSLSAQVYVPTTGTVSNKPYAPSQNIPTDSRSMLFDGVNFLWRPYQSPTEVLTYLSNATPKYRGGNFIIIVDSGGTLNSNGTYTGGTNTFWMFRDGLADANLIKLNFSGGGGGGSGTVTSVSATNGSGLTFTITNPVTTPNISIVTAAGGDVSGPLNLLSVNKFNGQLPSFYQNYNNLFNTPTIPAQLNPTCVGCTISGSYPNLTWTVTGTGFTTAGVDLIALSASTVALDTFNYRKVDTLVSPNDSTLIFTLNGVSHTLSLRGGAHGSGGGSGSVTSVSVVTANGVSGTVANPTSTPAITLTLGNITPTTVNGLTLTALTTGFTIAGGTTSKTLTVPLNASVSNTNTGDVTLAGENYLSIAAQVITANPVNVSGTNITGILKAASEPAHTGDVTNSAGSLALTIANNAVTNAKLAQAGSLTIKGNNTGGTANEADLTVAQVNAILPVFTTTLNGLVTAPGSVAGKVLSDNGTWVTNGTGSTNLNIGTGFRLAVPSTNNIKTLIAGFAIKMDSTSTANTITITADTSILAVKGTDTIYVRNAGASGLGILYSSADTIFGKKLVAGANMTITQNADSSLTFTSSGGGASGILFIGAVNSQPPQANGAFISGDTLYLQYETATVPGLLSTITQTIAGAKSFSSAPSFTTLTTNGGTVYLNGAGTVQQGGAGTSTQVWHGGTSPTMGPVVMTTDITGITPILNGGTGTSTPGLVAGAGISITGSWPNNTITNTALGTVTSVAVSGGTTGLTTSGGPITSSGTITLAGTLGIPNGGTGGTSWTPYAVFAGGATATGVLQQVSGVGTAGQVLTSNGAGTLPSWQAGGGGGGGVAIDAVQTYTSGTTLTQTTGVNIIQVNPATTQSTLAVTTATSANWHNSNDLYIVPGGTILTGTVITAFSFVVGSGLTLIDDIPPTTLQAGHPLRYHKIGSLVYRYKD